MPSISIPRRFRLVLFPLALATACAAPPHSGPTPAPASPEALRAAWQDAFNRADTAALVALYAADAVLLPPGGTMLTGGRTAVQQTVGREMEGRTLRLGTIHQRISGGLGHLQGTWQGRPRGDGGIDSGRYLMLFQRDADGGWRIAYHVWTRDAEPAIERASVRHGRSARGGHGNGRRRHHGLHSGRARLLFSASRKASQSPGWGRPKGFNDE